jgi:putative two-component system response regulator
MKILIADDDPAMRMILERRVSSWGYDVVVVENGRDAIELLQSEKGPRLALLDWVMPEKDGVEVCKHFKDSDHLIYLILLTGKTAESDLTVAIDSGAHNFLSKPISFPVLKRFIEVGERLITAEDKLREQEKGIRMRCYEAIANLAEARDEDTGSHMKRLSGYSSLLASQVTDDEAFIGSITTFAALHDIGKVGIPDRILLAPRKLSEEEFEIIKSHSSLGHQILQGVPTLEMAADIARYHHEKWNGKGYPDGLKGHEIPLSARILAIADVYDALRSKRPYKRCWSHEEAVELIISEAGEHFDPVLCEKFQKVQDQFDVIFQTIKDE